MLESFCSISNVRNFTDFLIAIHFMKAVAVPLATNSAMRKENK